MYVYILRHGKAQDHNHTTGDFKRNLTVAGSAEVEQIGTSMKNLGLSFDTIATSPLNRARQTAQIVAKRIGAARPAEWDELKPEADLASLYGKLYALGVDSRVLLVGHEPHLSCLIADVMTGGQDTGCGLVLRKPGLARLAISTLMPDQLSGNLDLLLTPKVLRRLS
jgi:phosphohistidine phosphatase